MIGNVIDPGLLYNPLNFNPAIYKVDFIINLTDYKPCVIMSQVNSKLPGIFIKKSKKNKKKLDKFAKLY